MSLNDILDTTTEMRRIVADAQATGWSTADVRSRLGSLKDYCDQIDGYARALDAPVTPPAPPPVPASPGFAGSYAGHDPAIDAYLGGDWGPHHGIALRAPAPGRVELYQFGTPLPAMYALDPVRQAEYEQNHQALFDGWVCMASPSVVPAAGQQQMAVFVWWPDAPFSVDGVALAWIGGAHVDAASVRQGHVNTDDVMAYTSNSGINFERAGYAEARAAHWHAMASRSRTLSPNGDVSGSLAIKALGFPMPRMGPRPGPNDYERIGPDGKDLYCAGRLRAEFTAAGQPIPPPPPGQ